MVTKKQELKKLTWLYFLQQKALELLIIPAIIGVGVPLALFARWLDPIMSGGGNLICEELVGLKCWAGYAAMGMMTIILCALVLTVVGLILYVFITMNWDKATERAEAKLKEKKR